MRILHVLNSRIYSGAEHVVTLIVKNMPKEYECAYLSPRGDIEEHLREQNIKYYMVNELSKKSINDAIEKFQPDIIHAHDFRASILASSVYKKNIIVISHLHHNAPWLEKRGIKSIFYMKATRNIDRILTVSDAIKNEYIYSDRIHYKLF